MRLSYDELTRHIQSLTAEVSKCDKEIKALEKRKDQHNKVIQNNTLEARKLQHKLKQWEKDAKEAAKIVNSYVTKHPWIETEKAHFGQAGSDYDFSSFGTDGSECRQRLQTLKSEQVQISCCSFCGNET